MYNCIVHIQPGRFETPERGISADLIKTNEFYRTALHQGIMMHVIKG